MRTDPPALKTKVPTSAHQALSTLLPIPIQPWPQTALLYQTVKITRLPPGRSPIKRDDGFVARKFSDRKQIDVATLWENEPARYLSAVEHIDANKPKSSPWISTTRSWDWAIWWMALNKHPLSTHKLKIAVIDLTLLPPPGPDTNLAKSSRPHQGIVLHALDLISRAQKEKPIPSDKLERVTNYANSADEVLVYAKIPLSAIVSTVTLDVLKLSIKAYIEPNTSEHWTRRVYDWAFGPPDPSKTKRFPVARGQWVRKFRELGMNESQWGEECAGFAFLLLRKQIVEIDKVLRKLEARKPSRGHDASTGTSLQTNKGLEKGNKEAGGEESDEEDLDNPQLSNVRAANFKKALEGPGLDIYKDAGASVGSWMTLQTMMKRRSNFSMGHLDDTNSPPELSPLLWTNLSMLPKQEDLRPAPPVAGSSKLDQDAYYEQVLEARRRLNLLYDQLVMLASCIPEPYWHAKPHNHDNWVNMKQAIVKRSTELVDKMEKTMRGMEQSDNQGQKTVFLNFVHEHRPHWWVYGPNT